MNYINFNNAGSSFVTNQTLNTIKKLFDYENHIGGYNAENLYKKKIIDFYFNTAKLINCDPSEISFLQNSTYKLNFFSSIINKKMKIIILDNEYGNLIGIIDKN